MIYTFDVFTRTMNTYDTEVGVGRKALTSEEGDDNPKVITMKYCSSSGQAPGEPGRPAGQRATGGGGVQCTLYIIGGYWTWGNFWTSPTADNYSDTCADSDRNRICDDGYNVSDQSSSSDYSGYNIDVGALMYGNSTPNMGYGEGTWEDGANVSSNSIYVNLTNGEADISNITFS